MTNPPLTFVINIMNVLALINKTPEMMVPTVIGTLATGGTISAFYPHGVAKKYAKGDVSQVKLSDIVFHWLPAVTFYTMYGHKIKNRHVAISLILPLIYFSVKHSTNSVKLMNPIEHAHQIYPEVPTWVFSLYVISALSFLK